MKKTLISLFSSAGVGDFGFKKAGFETIATNEILEERMNIQKLNKKCRYNTGYIDGDITQESTKQRIMQEIAFWEKNHKIHHVDVVLATPPCQGMSTANFKKKDELPRNSLVIESLELIEKIKPRYFIIENVRSFLKTTCFDKKDKEFKTIEEAIFNFLGDSYNIHAQVINFSDYGVPSSRPRTIVIGSRKDILDISPLLIFPDREKTITLRDAIGQMKKLDVFSEFDNSDPLHMFREYPSYMREWISGLKEGESSFHSSKIKPYKIINGEKIKLRGEHLGNKFSRMFWDRPAPAIHTRSDQIASNRTIHPRDDRVLSIRELMRVMTIPDDFIWFNNEDFENSKDKIKFLRSQELKIRRSIGEAVPTKIFSKIANNILFVDSKPFKDIYDFQFEGNRMQKNAAFYTPQSVIFQVLNKIKISKKEISILEPSVGSGAFLIQIIKKFQSKNKVKITLMDVDISAIEKGKKLFSKIRLPENIKVEWKIADFLTDTKKYDVIIGNPPYKKVGSKNLYSLFIQKALENSDIFSFIIPKTFLNSDKDYFIRNSIKENRFVSYLCEFGVRTFPNVNIETMVLTVQKNKSNYVEISRYFGKSRKMKQNYIFLNKIWIPYRDEKFDLLFSNMTFDVFNVYRDRQITNKYLLDEGRFRVIKSKNIEPRKIATKEGYDKFINDLDKFNVKKFLNKEIIIVPNFTYNFRAAKLPSKSIGNGSIVFLEPKKEININETLRLLNTREYNYYYSVLQSFSKFTININKSVGFYLGIINEGEKNYEEK